MTTRQTWPLGTESLWTLVERDLTDVLAAVPELMRQLSECRARKAAGDEQEEALEALYQRLAALAGVVRVPAGDVRRCGLLADYAYERPALYARYDGLDTSRDGGGCDFEEPDAEGHFVRVGHDWQLAHFVESVCVLVPPDVPAGSAAALLRKAAAAQIERDGVYTPEKR